MTAERESMTLQEMDAPALGVEERRDEAPGAGASHARPTPDPEVVAKPKRRKFTAQYRLRILEEAESCTQPGEVGRLLRREGLYSSHLTEWRRARREGSLQGLTPSKRGRKPAERNPLSAKVHELEAKVARLGLGSYKSAWLLLHKLRRAMVDPDRSLLEDLVEIDEATLPFRTVKDPTTGGQGRSRQGKMRIAGAVELSPEGEPRRIRLAPIGDFSARSLHAFVAGTSAPGARVITDGWSGYPGLPDHDHQPKVVGATPAHLVLIWIHRVFSNLKRWALGTFHGLRRAHLRRYLDEFVFRWNRRRHTATAFDTLLGIGARLRPADYRDIVGQRG